VAFKPKGCQWPTPVADLHAVRISKFRDRQIPIRFDLDHRQVGFFVHANNFCIEFCGLAIQLDLNLVA